ncbi:MAG TPA: hypothetical protein VLK84_21840, partial [Longimicrobium sp.]|nr:hypothetical protein [Longimicrobium sp.]
MEKNTDRAAPVGWRQSLDPQRITRIGSADSAAIRCPVLGIPFAKSNTTALDVRWTAPGTIVFDIGTRN